ncbi:MAG: NADH-quinone oxidoreductase subunit NuoI [Candidatus Zixiibacteriota bacterium]
MADLIRILASVFLAIPKGLATTFKHLFRKTTTIAYPRKPAKFAPRYRGLHYLTRYLDGEERCVACGLCAIACPSDCIYLEPEENERGERVAKLYEIDEIRCIFCGYCEEACPEEAIRLGWEFEFSQYDRKNFVWTKEMLLENFDKLEKGRAKGFIRERKFQFRAEPETYF